MPLRLKKLYYRLLDSLKAGTKKYFLIISAYSIWIIFMDEDSLVLLIKMKREISQHERYIEFLETEIAKIQNLKNDILNNPEIAEKFARENYYMKKKNEDLYVIVP